jgi:hypothetical protein
VQLAHNLSVRRDTPPDAYDASHLDGHMIGTGEALKYQAFRVLDRQDIQAGVEFLMQWKGFIEADATWEPESALEGCADLIRDFASREAAIKKKQSVASKQSKVAIVTKQTKGNQKKKKKR